MTFTHLALLGGLAATALAVRAEEGGQTFQSPPRRAHLVELFTSEGCSSCPPAEDWLRGLRENAGLWREVVPVAWHVDYWDSLGWKDRWASPLFTRRQRDYASAWGSRQIYTPCFVLNGREWRDRALPPVAGEPGVLTVRVAGAHVTAHFAPAAGGVAAWDVWLAPLGGNLESDVKAGENSGRKLRHEFVALSLDHRAMLSARAGFTADFPSAGLRGARALAVWVTGKDSLTPVQATGGWLTP